MLSFLPSSPPVPSSPLMYRANQRSPDPPTPQFPVRKISFASEPPRIRLYHQSKESFRPSSPIVPSDGLDAALLTACEEAENNDHHNAEEAGDATAEFEANRAFLEENLELEDNESDDKSGGKSEDDESEDNSENLNQPTYESHLENNSWINDCTTENAKLKLIRILKGEALVPKQRWSLGKILATLVCH